MDTALWVLTALVLGGFGMQFFLSLREKGTSGASTAEYERLKAELESIRREKDELSGKGKQLSVSFVKLESDHKALFKERDVLHARVARFEAEHEQRQNKQEEMIQKLEAAERALENERKRVVRADEEEHRRREEERDRLWAEHEIAVIAQLTDLCKQPTLSFTSYSNTNLPDGFDGSLKPDFMIEFLGQYVIFDAKVSKAKSLQTYINKQVEDSVEKVKENEKIFRWLFLVVPTQAISELKKHHYIVDGYHVFIVAPEALPAILACLKHITLYEFAEQMDPQQRENIVQIVADLDFHINVRNAADIVFTKMGADLLERTQRMDPGLAEEVAIKKQPLHAKVGVSTAELKKLVSNLTAQNMEIQKLVSPKTAVQKNALKDAGNILEETLS